ncbi:MAG TPA: ABC transporter substrate-binding protein [Cyanobacteria bacterium UBA11162]|nr:ABC transporter substrate-binding protein [Cyanobacteria bacterium UBA11162]
MTKILLRWLIVLLVILSLTSCNSSSTNGITTVTLSGWQSSPTEKQRIEQVLKDFQTTHPHINVKFEVITDQYMDVIRTRLIGDAAPDVFYLDASEAPLLMSNGVLEPLDNYITPDLDLADFKPGFLEAFKYNGRTYGLPKDFSTLGLFYNKKLFEKAGLSTPPKTWDELEDYSQKLTLDRNQDGRREQYGLGIVPELPRQYFMIKAFDGDLANEQGYATFASPNSLKGLQDVINQYRKDRSSVVPSDVGASSASEMLGQGRVGMVIEGNWAIPYLQETFPTIEFGTTEIPSINGKAGTMAYTVAYVMNKQAKHKNEAWELISYLTGKEGMKAWSKGGVVLPTRNSVLAELGYDNSPLYLPFIKGADYATLWQAQETLPIIVTHFNNQFLSALIGEQILQVAMNKAQRLANEEIQEANY